MSLGAESPAWGNAGAACRVSQVDSGRAEACSAMSRCVRLVVSCLVESSPVEARSVASSQSGRVAFWHARSRRVQAGQSCLYLSSRAVSSSAESVPSSLARFCRVESCPVSRVWSCGGKFGRVLPGQSSRALLGRDPPCSAMFRQFGRVDLRRVWPRRVRSRQVWSARSRRVRPCSVRLRRVLSSQVSPVWPCRVSPSPVAVCSAESVVSRHAFPRRVEASLVVSSLVASVKSGRDWFGLVVTGQALSRQLRPVESRPVGFCLVSRVRFRRGMPCHAEACLPVRILSLFHGG